MFIWENSEERAGVGYAGPAWKMKGWEGCANGRVGLV